MKNIVLSVVIVVLALGQRESLADDEDIFWGALIGASAGLLLGDSVDGLHSSVAVPIGAMAGGVIGHELGRATVRSGGRHYYDRSGRRRLRRGYGYYGYPVPVRPYRRVRVKAPKPARQPKPVPPPNYHPGVDVVKVQIQLVTGVAMDVRLLRMADNTFVGPQGETYATLPRAAELTQYSGKQ